MGRGKGLAGHKRILTPLGLSSALRRSPDGAWEVGCDCGWKSEELCRIVSQAQAAYSSHIDDLLANGLFLCRRCEERKPLAEMRRDYRHVCRACFSKLGNEWQRANPGRSATHKRNHSYLKRYGVTDEEVQGMVAAQDGRCGICQRSVAGEDGLTPHVDHDHETGRVRGVLCFSCNSGMGLFADDIERLRSAISYLEKARGG